MIKLDREIAHRLLKSNLSYTDVLCYDSQRNLFQIVSPKDRMSEAIGVKFDPVEVAYSLYRLRDKHYISITRDIINNIYFSITPELRHRHAFFWDRFTKKFLFGYISGIISGIIISVVGGLLVAYIRSVLGI